MYELTERIKYSQLDRFGNLSLVALLDLFQDCATMHTEDVGFPMDWFIENRQGWFVTSYQIKNYRLPRHGEIVNVKTLPVKVKGFMGYRLFVLEDKDGTLLSESYSEWVHMDLNAVKPMRVPKEMMDAYIICDVPENKWESRKVEKPSKTVDCGSFKVEGLFVDTNFHMNNAYYIEPALNALEDKKFSFIKMEFKNPALLGDVVYINKDESKDRSVVSLDSKNGDCYCIIEFRK